MLAKITQIAPTAPATPASALNVSPTPRQSALASSRTAISTTGMTTASPKYATPTHRIDASRPPTPTGVPCALSGLSICPPKKMSGT